MATATLTIPQRLDTVQSAEYCGCRPASLETYRTRGGGPRFIKIGRKVQYLVRDLDAWIESRSGMTTAEISGK